MPTQQIVVTRQKAGRPAWLIPGAILLLLLIAGGAFLLLHFLNPRGTLNLTLPVEIAQATIQVTSSQDNREVASAAFEEGQAELRVPLDQDLKVTVSATGYQPWTQVVRLDDTTRQKDVPIRLVGANGTLTVM